MGNKNSIVLMAAAFSVFCFFAILPSVTKAQTAKRSVKRTTVKRRTVARKTKSTNPICPNEPVVFGARATEFKIASESNNQTSSQQISIGVLNGKSVNLVTPSYPPVARAVHASGAVNIQVMIDKQGNVETAKAVGGYPLLRQAAEQAALQSKFSPTTLNGCPVKVSGIVVYNFVAQ
ncbi:MAG: energy transducer TonB [Pyrinomonadaceae bacterium]